MQSIATSPLQFIGAENSDPHVPAFAAAAQVRSGENAEKHEDLTLDLNLHSPQHSNLTPQTH